MSSKFDEPDEAEKLRRVLGRMNCCKHCMGNEVAAQHMQKERATILNAQRFSTMRLAEHGKLINYRNSFSMQLTTLKEFKKKTPEILSKIDEINAELEATRGRYEVEAAAISARRYPAPPVDEAKLAREAEHARWYQWDLPWNNENLKLWKDGQLVLPKILKETT